LDKEVYVMGFDGGDLLRLGKKVIKGGAPLLGGALGGPAGSVIFDLVAAVTGKDTPQEAEAVLDKQPELYVKLKEVEIAQQTRLEELFYEDLKDRRALIKAEVTSEDVFVRRARPMFLYIMYAVIVFDFILLPFIRIFNPAVPEIVLPGELYWLFGSAYTGYSVLRSMDKTGKSPAGLFGIFNGGGKG
jgi:hypothetical protein